MNRIILIGGAPTAGKSYTAKRIAEDLKLPWISTDTIREQMRKIVRKEDFPRLFVFSEATSEMAVEYLTKHSADAIVREQNDESKEVWYGVRALIETDYVWDGVIIEGVAVLPEFVSKISSRKDVTAVFLVDDDVERIRNTIFTRGLWDAADRYPDHVKEKEVEWVLAFNAYIREEAEKYGFPVISIGDREEYLKKIHELVN